MTTRSELAVIYTRVSTDEQTQYGVSLDAQECACKELCAKNGWTVVSVLREEGVSGGKMIAERPQGIELLRLVESKAVGHVVVLKSDRLSRDLQDALGFVKICLKNRVEIQKPEGRIDMTDPHGFMVETMLYQFAQLERMFISSRTKSALQYKKQRLQVYNKVTPFGFERVDNSLVPVERELSLVRKAIQMRNDGRKLREIAAYLNNSGMKPRNGGEWGTATVDYIIKNDIYQGEYINAG